MFTLFPDPGVLPTMPSPSPGESVVITVDGLPPYKDKNFSVRNPQHPKHGACVKLRRAAMGVMAGRKWYDGPVRLVFTLFAPSRDRDIVDYLGGIQDALGGSHGFTFTYLPIVFQDDSQVVSIEGQFVESSETRYTIKVLFE